MRSGRLRAAFLAVVFLSCSRGRTETGNGAPGVPEAGALRPEPVLRVVDKPIRFTALRRDLTLDYIRRHYDPRAADIAIQPRMIVIHWTGSGTLASAYATLNPEELPLWRPEIRKGGRLNVSAHFLVDRDGTIYRLMPENWMARHTIGLNMSALGVENVGGPSTPLTEAQLDANTALVRLLVAAHPGIRYLIGHHEYLRFRDSPLWRESDLSYSTGKIDPGDGFIKALRSRVADLKLKGQP